MGMHLRQRVQRRITHRVKDMRGVLHFLLALCSSYRIAEFLPLTPLLFCLGLLSMLPDWMLEKADQGAEVLMCLLLGGKRAHLRDSDGTPTGQACLYSLAGVLDPEFTIPDKRLLCVPKTEAERQHAFPSKQASGWGNASFLSLCMKLSYEDWQVVRDVVNHEWRLAPEQGDDAVRKYLRPRFVKGASFHFMQPAGIESSEELSHIHLDSDACLLAVEDPDAGEGGGVALVLAFRGTEPLELADFQSDFDAVPEAGEWGSLHPGFLLALGLDPNLNPYHQTLTTYTALIGEAPAASVVASQPTTPYEVLRDEINRYMVQNPNARLYVTGHSLGGALAVVFTGALMHDSGKQAAAAKARMGALYTFGQPRVGDYEFLCHLQVALLESTDKRAKAPGEPGEGAGAGASKLRGLLAKHGAGQQDEPAGPPLTSRYIRIVNTYDIVPNIPPTLMNVYQHGGDLLYLTTVPGTIKWLTEQPMFFITGVWTSSVYKLYHFGCVAVGLNKNWKGCDNYIRYGMRVGAVFLPFLIAGLNDHMPGDYSQQVINSTPEAWQPFRTRRKFSRWANALLFTRALATSKPVRGCDGEDTAAPADQAARPAGARAGHATLSSKLQATLMAQAERSAAPPAAAGNGALPAAANGAAPKAAKGAPAEAARGASAAFKRAAVAAGNRQQ